MQYNRIYGPAGMTGPAPPSPMILRTIDGTGLSVEDLYDFYNKNFDIGDRLRILQHSFEKHIIKYNELEAYIHCHPVIGNNVFTEKKLEDLIECHSSESIID